MKLTEKQLEIVARTAAAVAIEKYQAEQQERERHKHDRRLRNVKLLLRNYRSFVTHSADIKLDIVELDEELELDDLDTDEFAVMSIKKSKKKTLAMVKFINKTLQVYKLMCEESRNGEDLRKYEIIYHMYISEEKKTVAEISKVHFITERAVYKIINKASEDLSVLIFGIDGIRFS